MIDTEYISAHIGDEEILLQLAEECAELSHAALKLRRVMAGKNPTPKTRAEAHADFLEELGDIRAVCAVLLVGKLGECERKTVADVTAKKLTRWRIRLEDKEEMK